MAIHEADIDLLVGHPELQYFDGVPLFFAEFFDVVPWYFDLVVSVWILLQ